MMAVEARQLNGFVSQAVSEFAFGARVCDPQRRDLPGDVLRLTEPRSANWDTAVSRVNHWVYLDTALEAKCW